ncbi:hypothetical protein PHYBLDRAFT_123428 [Phycomyces blakesleeanus NRRL 1555(-)]|uniref:Uncharacterized protein n=1 Tax=Phycomyces blakesleeanus (strain ATCC 8743b / DSM 1359 / FGSC 10004 / NBRC 33097 / NRRL 1555) TaxID=763407 RepID=A0A162ULG3_PHYB8|nr:hypothetical protein PHYBLDRAFT_123428 [Phycomyces blakesleeanus NRRL 1555(-)]OAD76143.1 hypothetical protein PHYBLDRAFT_123428 [Phycomyces blakesleeanus NRRL 1555(-)]|eukprot:XP_018294183.1 hypothetical protein PHYBLDRAFT_123428 [Phycomyces blakesleeanus NRRL 1555(-)]
MPLSTTNFRAIDQGNCNPRFMRSTLREIPVSYDLWNDSGLPLGLIVQPLADLHQADVQVPLASTSAEGPVRCQRCKGYINPWCRFVDGGRKFMCNLCGFDNEVPSDYFCHLDMTGWRTDIEFRPELQLGSVEFDVPEEYWTRKPAPVSLVFAIDVSWSAVKSGMVESVCSAIQGILYEGSGLDKETKVAILTFDSSVCFYNIKASRAELEQAQMMVVSDVNDIFLPLSEGFLVDPVASKRVIEDLLRLLPSIHTNNRATVATMGSAVQGSLLALKETGGKVHIFQSLLPTLGPGALKGREDQKLYGTDKEKQLFLPQNPFYTTIGKECVQSGVCVDLWLFPQNTIMDLSTLGVLPALTGGDTHFYPNFDSSQHGALVHSLERSLKREQGYNAALRVRCSNGISIEDQYGNFDMQNATDIELAGIDADSSIGFSLKYDARLKDTEELYFQCALLYTTTSGLRRVRVHTLCLPVTGSMHSIFKHADVEVSLSLISKKIISQATKRSLNEINLDLDVQCVKILTAYRKYCAASSSPGQLVLPDSFKVLPIYTLCLKKSALLRRDPNVTSDVRVYTMRAIKSASIAETIKWIYPRMIKVHEMLVQDNVNVTPMERLSYSRLSSSGIYLIESHIYTFLWIGQHATPELLQNVFGVTQSDHIDSCMTQIPALDNTLSRQLCECLDNDYSTSPEKARLYIIRQGLDSEQEFVKTMVEDETYGQMSYVDYLCLIHRQVLSELEKDKQEAIVSSASYWAYRY